MFYEKIAKSEIDAMERSDGITPNYTYELDEIIRDEETEEVIEWYYINLTINKTADEVYTESLNPKPTPPDKNEIRLDELEQENKLIKAQVEALSAEGEFRDELIAEMAMKVYA